MSRLGTHPTSDISDLVGRLYTMTSEIRPLHDGAIAFSGSAVTVRTPRGDNRAVKQVMVDLKEGDVLVIDAQGFTGWCSGGFSMLGRASASGYLAGIIVNGAYRDVQLFEDAGIPLYAISATPATGPKLGPGDINVPVSCGNVVIHPGDVVVADADGVVVIPLYEALNVVDVLESGQQRSAP